MSRDPSTSARARRSTRSKEPTPAPTAAQLHEAALSYLTARAASAAQVERALERRVAAWARRAVRAGTDESSVHDEARRARDAIAGVLERLSSSGLVDDERFARQRASALARGGKSRRAVVFDLARRGVEESIAREAGARDAATELAAAVTFARKKRLGPFAKETPSPELRRKWLAAFARAGYGYDVAERALRLDRESAEAIVRELRPAGW
ncbi:MAG: RecX family transcriptional regulator [Deltaproteobacteria bacterium]|nr:RecX family transcriptional regulator [Deltaproteobacteria bacterium]